MIIIYLYFNFIKDLIQTKMVTNIWILIWTLLVVVPLGYSIASKRYHGSSIRLLLKAHCSVSRSLQTSVSREVRILASLVSKDIQSNTGKNLAVIQRTCGFNPRSVSPTVIRKHPIKTEVPVLDQWRIPVLDNWLKLRREMTVNLQNTENISLLIDALCST